MVTRSRLKRKGSRKKTTRLNKFKWKNFEFEKDSDGNLNMTKPEYYEGVPVDNKPTTKDFESIVADWIDMPYRDLKLSDEEIRALNQFNEKEQKRIFGLTTNEAIKIYGKEG